MSVYEYVGSELDVFSLAANWKRYFARLIQPFILGDVLEVGAGIGETTGALYDRRVTRWVCLEPDARLAKRLANRAVTQNLRVEIVVGDISAVGSTERFDAIIYVDVLEHIRNDEQELRFAAARLNEGGHLIVLAPAFQCLYSRFDESIGHERRYTRRTLATAFPRNLERVALFYADSIGMMLSLANRLLLRQSLPRERQILLWDRVVIPLSRLVDPLVLRSFGRSVIGIYRAPRGEGVLS
jgi:SAM-dependent methyltransferase